MLRLLRVMSSLLTSAGIVLALTAALVLSGVARADDPIPPGLIDNTCSGCPNGSGDSCAPNNSLCGGYMNCAQGTNCHHSQCSCSLPDNGGTGCKCRKQ